MRAEVHLLHTPSWSFQNCCAVERRRSKVRGDRPEAHPLVVCMRHRPAILSYTRSIRTTNDEQDVEPENGRSHQKRFETTHHTQRVNTYSSTSHDGGNTYRTTTHLILASRRHDGGRWHARERRGHGQSHVFWSRPIQSAPYE